MRHVLSHAAGLPCFPPAAADLAFDDLRRADRAAGRRRAGPRARDRRRRARAHLRPPLRRTGRAARPATTSPTGSPGSPRRTGGTCTCGSAPADLGRVADVVAARRAGRATTPTTRAGARRSAGHPGCSTPTCSTRERFRRCSFPAIALHASARGLARFYADLMADRRPGRGAARARAARGVRLQPRRSGHDLRARPRGLVDARLPGRRRRPRHGRRRRLRGLVVARGRVRRGVRHPRPGRPRPRRRDLELPWGRRSTDAARPGPDRLPGTATPDAGCCV